MHTIHISIDHEDAPKNASEVVKYLREMACVDPETGHRRLPTYIDDEVFLAAALYIERQEAWIDVILDRILSDDRPMTDKDWERAKEFDAAIEDGKAKYRNIVRKRSFDELASYLKGEV